MHWYAIMVVLGLAMSDQAAAAQQRGVPDVSTAVVTMRVVAMASDRGIAGRPGDRSLRGPQQSYVCMLLGTLAGSRPLEPGPCVDLRYISVALDLCRRR